MDERKEANSAALWQAFGPAKEAWKAAGNYYTAEQLVLMAKDFQGLRIKRRSKKVYNAN